MITPNELQELLASTETYRVEKTISTTNTDKFCQTICAFSNDMPNSGKKGYLLIGVNDDGTLSGLHVTDELKIKISAIRSDGNILPLPIMNVESFSFNDGDVLVVEVTPSRLPPVRYRGRTYIRIGPRKDFATIEDERILIERISCNYPSFDTTPCREASINDINIRLFINDYLPKAISEEDEETDTRSVKEKMAALRLFNLQYDCPTYAAIILFGNNPEYFLMGDYIQYVRFAGLSNADDITNEYKFSGNLMKILPQLATFIEVSLIEKRPIPVSALKEEIRYNYPQWAIRELLMNTVMHRDYNSNTPTKFYQYSNRLEIVNAGSLYGNAKPHNFPYVNDYRNPLIAEALKVMGYVNKFNRGITRVEHELMENGNDKTEFTVDKITVFEAKVNIATNKATNIATNKATNIATNKATNIATNKATNIATNKATNIATNKATNIATNKATNIATNKAEQTEKFTTLDIDNNNEKALSVLTKLSTIESMSSKELFESLKITNQTYNYGTINKLKKGGFIISTSDKPTSPNQKYAITELGKFYLSYKKGGKQ